MRDAEDKRRRPDPDHVSVPQLDRLADLPAAKRRPILAAEVLEDRAMVIDHYLRVPPRARLFIDTGDHAAVPPETVLAGVEAER